MVNKMTETRAQIGQIEDQIEEALWSFETGGDNRSALAAYQEAETSLQALAIQAGDTDYAEYQRVLAYCLMRQGNILRQSGQIQEALALSEREIAAAWACGDSITLARSLMSNGINQIVAGWLTGGMELMEEARSLFAMGDSYDHRQGRGWCWLTQADLINAGLLAGGPPGVIEAADRALEILLPIENWPGVARAYEARALARERSGNQPAAKADRLAQRQAESRIGPQSDLAAGK